MVNGLINSLGDLFKNSKFDFKLTDWPAATAWGITGLSIGGAVVAVVAIREHVKSNRLEIVSREA
jgi:hypothetical protein